MKITEVRINKYDSGNTKGFASITIDGDLVVTGITIIDGSNGLFVGMPNRKDKNGDFKDIVFPTSKDARDVITKAVLDAFNAAE